MCNFLFFLFNIQVASGGEAAYEARGLQLWSHPQGTRTHDWPAQPATKPPAPGPHHTQAKWLIGKKIHIYSKKWGESEESQRATIIECTTPLTEQLTHCNHMGQQCMY